MSVSRLFVESDLLAGRRGAAGRGTGPLSAPRHAPARWRTARCCSTAATANGAPRSRAAARRRPWRGWASARASRSREPDVWLCFAPIKRARIDFIAEKATELGVAVLQPVLTHHTIVERVNVERLRANAIEAAEQTERLSVPEVRPPVELAAPARRLAGRAAAADVRRDRRRSADRRGAGRPRCGGARCPVGHRDRARRAASPRPSSTRSSHKGCYGGRAGPAHPARRYRGACGARLLAGAGRRLAAADTASGRRLSHIQGPRLTCETACARPCRCGRGEVEHHEPAACSRENCSCDRAAPRPRRLRVTEGVEVVCPHHRRAAARRSRIGGS